jgi:hypothetical protein
LRIHSPTLPSLTSKKWFKFTSNRSVIRSTSSKHLYSPNHIWHVIWLPFEVTAPFSSRNINRLNRTDNKFVQYIYEHCKSESVSGQRIWHQSLPSLLLTFFKFTHGSGLVIESTRKRNWHFLERKEQKRAETVDLSLSTIIYTSRDCGYFK